MTRGVQPAGPAVRRKDPGGRSARPAPAPQAKQPTPRPVKAPAAKPAEETTPRRRIIGLVGPAAAATRRPARRSETPDGPQAASAAIGAGATARPAASPAPEGRPGRRVIGGLNAERRVASPENARVMHHGPESLDREPDPRGAVHRLVPIVENLPIARDTYRLRLADATIAGSIRPGQFVMIRPVDGGVERPAPGPAAGPVRRGPRRLRRVHRLRRRVSRDRARDRRDGPTTARRAAIGLGPAGQRLRPGAWGSGHLRGRRHRPDAVPGPGSRVAGIRVGRLHVGHAALRRADGRPAGRRGGLPRGGDRGRGRDRRRDGRAPRVRHRAAGPPPGTRRTAGQGRRLRAARHAGRPRPARRSPRHRLRRLAGKSHGLRLRRLLQLRGTDSPARRLDRPEARLRRGAGVLGGECGRGGSRRRQ